ncbi:MAG TPA: hypothetical protein PLD88_07135, partial [Candidatus Berkiella sp.]|nr:hypothetical protein [Candidatus Berkiella sp.]
VQLANERIIYRDLHHKNSMVSSNDLEVNFIDFGLALDADKDGLYSAKAVSDVLRTGANVQYANSIDIIELENYSEWLKNP